MAWVKVPKTASTYTTTPKVASFWNIISYLKREQSDYILLESGDKIVISGDNKPATAWSKITKY